MLSNSNRNVCSSRASFMSSSMLLGSLLNPLRYKVGRLVCRTKTSLYGLLELNGSKWLRDITARQIGLLRGLKTGRRGRHHKHRHMRQGLAGGGKKLKAWNLGEVQIQEHTVESGLCL